MMRRLKAKDVAVVYEPVLNATNFFHFRGIKGLAEFKHIGDVIVVNRVVDELADVPEKIYTRDLFDGDS